MRAIAGKLQLTGVCLVGLLFSSAVALADEGLVTKDEIIRLTNQERQQAGLPELVENTTLDMAAMKKAQDMIGNNYFAHTSPAGVDPWHWFDEAGYQYKYAGENLAMDFSTAGSVSRAWMKSPSHRDNILSDKFQEIGVAVAKGIIEDKETQVAVQLFGTPLSQSSQAGMTAKQAELESDIRIEEATIYPWKGDSGEELLVYAKVLGEPVRVEAIVGQESYQLLKHRQDTFMNLFTLSEIQSKDTPIMIKASIDDHQAIFYSLSPEQIVNAPASIEQGKKEPSVAASANENKGSALVKQFGQKNAVFSVALVFFLVIIANIWVLEKEEEKLLAHAHAS